MFCRFHLTSFREICSSSSELFNLESWIPKSDWTPLIQGGCPFGLAGRPCVPTHMGWALCVEGPPFVLEQPKESQPIWGSPLFRDKSSWRTNCTQPSSMITNLHSRLELRGPVFFWRNQVSCQSWNLDQLLHVLTCSYRKMATCSSRPSTWPFKAAKMWVWVKNR